MCTVYKGIFPSTPGLALPCRAVTAPTLYSLHTVTPSVEPLGELPHIDALPPVELHRVLFLIKVEAAELPCDPLEAEEAGAGRRHLQGLQLLLWGSSDVKFNEVYFEVQRSKLN